MINVPATVEMYMPNIYADVVEYVHRNMPDRERAILSVHPHNDRGTAVAAAEMALLAGAERVEGTLFGNGERTGNVDVVTMALNMFTQGVDPPARLLGHRRHPPHRRVLQPPRRARTAPLRRATWCTPRSPGRTRTPSRRASPPWAVDDELGRPATDYEAWEVPYLPIDPAHLGRNYEAVIRVNSQSGKGGVAYIMKAEHGLDLPRRLQIEFSKTIQHITEDTGTEITPAAMWDAFAAGIPRRASARTVPAERRGSCSARPRPPRAPTVPR